MFNLYAYLSQASRPCFKCNKNPCKNIESTGLFKLEPINLLWTTSRNSCDIPQLIYSCTWFEIVWFLPSVCFPPPFVLSSSHVVPLSLIIISTVFSWFLKSLFKGNNFAVWEWERGKFDFDHHFAFLTKFLKR